MTPTVHRHLLLLLLHHLLLHHHLHHLHHHLLLPRPLAPALPTTAAPSPPSSPSPPTPTNVRRLCPGHPLRPERRTGDPRLRRPPPGRHHQRRRRRLGLHPPHRKLRPKAGETNYGQAYWKASLPPPCYGRSLPVRPADIIGSLYENCKNFRPLLQGPATGPTTSTPTPTSSGAIRSEWASAATPTTTTRGRCSSFVTVWFDVPSNQINIQADADDELKKKVEADESLANEEAPEVDVPSLGADENDNAEDLHQTKADSFNFRVPSLGCPDGFADALVDGINQLRADDEDGNQFRPLKRDTGVLAFEASAWAATNRYLGNRRPRERRFGQNYWFWFGSPNTGNFRRTIDDFLGGGRGKHFRPMIWKRSDQFEDGWSWQPFTRAEWAATTRVGVGCLTDYNSFQGGQAQVFVSLFYDYTKKSGDNGEDEGERQKTGDSSDQRAQRTSRRPSNHPQNLISPRIPTPTRKHRPLITTQLPTSPLPFYPPDSRTPKRTNRPFNPYQTTGPKVIPSGRPYHPHPTTPSTSTSSTPSQKKSCDQLLQTTASQPMPFSIPSSSCPATFAKSIFCLLNEARQREHLPPLKMLSKKLNAEAANWTATKRAYGELWSGERRFGQTSFTIVDHKGRPVIPLKPKRLMDTKNPQNQSPNFRPKVWSAQQEAFVAMEDGSWARTAKLGVGCSGFKNATGSAQDFCPADGYYHFNMPTTNCSQDFALSLLGAVNDYRYTEGNPPLSLDQALGEEALAWATTNRASGDLKPGEGHFGQRWWSWFDCHNRHLKYISKRGIPFRPNIWDKKRGRTDHYDWRKYTDTEWEQTSKVGFGCYADWFRGKRIRRSAVLGKPIPNRAQVFVVAFFEFPSLTPVTPEPRPPPTRQPVTPEPRPPVTPVPVTPEPRPPVTPVPVTPEPRPPPKIITPEPRPMPSPSPLSPAPRTTTSSPSPATPEPRPPPGPTRTASSTPLTLSSTPEPRPPPGPTAEPASSTTSSPSPATPEPRPPPGPTAEPASSTTSSPSPATPEPRPPPGPTAEPPSSTTSSPSPATPEPRPPSGPTAEPPTSTTSSPSPATPEPRPPETPSTQETTTSVSQPATPEPRPPETPSTIETTTSVSQPATPEPRPPETPSTVETTTSVSQPATPEIRTPDTPATPPETSTVNPVTVPDQVNPGESSKDPVNPQPTRDPINENRNSKDPENGAITGEPVGPQMFTVPGDGTQTIHVSYD
ncbi:hypothetical protein TYRP_001599 [Tyrophagus putrescentiae]|nr:hypothetical protein TYRP_001599 [Tyrophagus putrescentiae]